MLVPRWFSWAEVSIGIDGDIVVKITCLESKCTYSFFCLPVDLLQALSSFLEGVPLLDFGGFFLLAFDCNGLLLLSANFLFLCLLLLEVPGDF